MSSQLEERLKPLYRGRTGFRDYLEQSVAVVKGFTNTHGEAKGTATMGNRAATEEDVE